MDRTTRVVVVILVGLAVCLAVGCVRTSGPAGLGTPVSSGPWELTVNKVDSTGTFEGKAAGSGKVWLVGKAILRNTGDTAGTFNPAWIGAGKGYDVYTGPVTVEGGQSPRQVPAGGTATLVAAFEIPVDTTEVALLFETPDGAVQAKLN